MAIIKWKAAVSGDFADGADWTGGLVPGSADIAEIEATGTYTVSSSLNESVRRLVLTQNASLDLTAGTFSVGVGDLNSAPVVSIGNTATVSVADGSVLELGVGTDDVAGALDIVASGTLSFASGLGSNFTGEGTVTLGGAGSEIDILPAALDILETVQGAGLITSSQTYLDNEGGVIDANQATSQLQIETGGWGGSPFTPTVAVLNGGTLEATNGGGLLLSSGSAGSPLYIINPGLLESSGSGSHVDLNNVVIEEGSMATSGGGVIQTLSGAGTLFGYSQDGPDPILDSAVILVNDGTTLSVVGVIDNTGTISLASTGHATSLRIESLADFPGNQKDTAQSRVVTLTGDGAVTLSDDSNNLIYATHATDSLDNEGNTITGAGQIGGGSTMGLINRGVIDATGENALVMDVASGTVTNGAHGVIEGSGAAGLVFSGGTLNNTGTVAALNGSAVLFEGSASVANDVGGALTGGVWKVTDSGGSASLTLNGAAITTLAATVVLTGDNSFFETGGQSLEAGLTTIAAKGKLELLAGRGWTTTNAVTDAGLLQLGGGTFTATSLTVGAGGTVSGVGAIDAPLTNDGLVEAGRGAFSLSGAVTGTGTLEILSQTTLDVAGSVTATQTVLFGAGVHANLELASPSAFAGVLESWAIGDTIDLAATNVTSAQISGDTLAIDIQGGGALDYTLANPATGARIVLSSDGAGGTNLTLYKALAPAALLTQALAAMPSGAAARSIAAAGPASAPLAVISSPTHA